jgi:DNA-binding transcriptional ArsR family regulator
MRQFTEKHFEHIAARFKTLSEVSRLKIIKALQDGELNVAEIVATTGLSQPNASRHLLALTQAKMLTRRKTGVQAYYSIVDKHLMDICAAVCKGLPNS